MSQYRILHCLRAPVGGLFRHVRDLAREQARRGHHVGMLCDAAASDALTDGLLADLAPDLALGIERLPMPRELGLGDIAAVARTARLGLALQVDILHGHGAKGGAYARLAARRMRAHGRRVATFYTPHGGSLHYAPSSLKGRLFMATERHLAKTTDGIVFESAYAAGVYAANVGQPPCLVRVIHNGIAPAEFEPVPAADDAADFVFVGELRRLKGVDLLIEAARRLTAEGRPVRAAIVGAGPEDEAFRQQAADAGLGQAIRFHGALPARRAFQLGRALVLPSRAESLPYVALEAAGAGLPLIATRVGGLPEIVAGTDTALVTADDPQALAAAMRTCLDAPDTAAELARRLHAVIARGFSISSMTDGVLSFYADATRRDATTAATELQVA